MTRISFTHAGHAGDITPSFALSDLPVPMVYATREDIVDRSFARLYPEIGDFIRRGEQWAANLAGHEVYYDERLMARLDGQRFWCRVNGRSLRPGNPFAEAIYCFEPINRPATQADRVLTERQRQILAQVAQGKTNAQIATETGLSRRTIEAHRARLMKAIGVSNGAELMAWFVSNDPRGGAAPAAR